MNLPPYSLFPTLSGNQVNLRQIKSSDFDELLEISFFNGIKALTIEQAIENQYKIQEEYLRGESIHWGIVDIKSDKIVGTCGYYRGFAKGYGELGCVLLPMYYGKGFMTHALQLAIDFGINHIGLNCIWAATSVKNSKAINLLTRLSFINTSAVTDNEVILELWLKK